jgi:hypothetical protein
MIENSLEKIGEEFNCTITGTTIKNRIITPDGFLYEESSIKNWIKNMPKDPMSISPLSQDQLIKSAQLKNALKKNNIIETTILKKNCSFNPKKK